MLKEQPVSLLHIGVINMYDYDKCKNNVINEMLKYEIYQYKYNSIPCPSITANYQFRYEQHTSNIVDKVGDFVQKKIDKEREVVSFYQGLVNIVAKFTKDERMYFILALLYKYCEDIVCEKMHVSSNGLVPIKKSCIIKLALYFGVEVMARVKEVMPMGA